MGIYLCLVFAIHFLNFSGSKRTKTNSANAFFQYVRLEKRLDGAKVRLFIKKEKKL